MKHTYISIKILSFVLAAVLLLMLTSCSVFRLTEEEITELEEDEVEVIVGQSIGQELAATYAADHVFSLNCVSSSSFNPYKISSEWNRVVGMLVYETLVALDGDFNAQPNLITAWTTEDGTSWTFSVDTSRQFHDGGTMTAADAVYSIQQAMAYGGKYALRLRHVIGISSLDEERFAITLDEANYRFYELLNLPCIEYGTAGSDKPAGTGPYKFSKSGTYLTINRNYPNAEALPIETVYLKEYSAAEDILQAFEDSYIDLVINDPTSMSSLGYSSTNITKYVDTTNLHYLGYNMSSLLFSQPAIRSVMTYAIDRASIVSNVMQGAGAAATLPVHPDSDCYPAEYAKSLAFSEESFETALRNIGASDVDGDGYLEFGGRRTTVNFVVCADSATKVSAARLIANELRAFGMDVDLREMTYDDYIKTLEDGDFDIYYAEVKLCADWDLSLLLNAGAALNYGDVRDELLATYIRSFLSSTEESREMDMAVLYQYIGQNAPITAICFEKSEVLYHRGVLSGLAPTQDNIFYGITDWTVTLD